MADKTAGAAPRRADAAASWRRRLKLQTDYGQAMMWSKGFAAEETKTAFARAAELAAMTDDFSERFAACHGQWTLEIVRGELRSARELASTFLREAEDAGRVVETGVAHRGLALIGYFSGDFLGAQTHCERALEACTPGHEEKARERFGEYTGASVMSCLAITSWQLGKVDRARELIEMANRRATELGHVPSMGYPLLFRSHLEVLRGDAAAALSSAEALKSCAREHGMTLWRQWAELSSAWARGRLDDPAAAAAEFRRDLAAVPTRAHDQHGVFSGPARATRDGHDGHGDRAEAHRRCVGPRRSRRQSLLPLLYPSPPRQILLKRDPSIPPPPSRRSGLHRLRPTPERPQSRPASGACTRQTPPIDRPSGGSARRPRPALEGFSPTPEMPEIAEAMSLSA